MRTKTCVITASGKRVCGTRTTKASGAARAYGATPREQTIFSDAYKQFKREQKRVAAYGFVTTLSRRGPLITLAGESPTGRIVLIYDARLAEPYELLTIKSGVPQSRSTYPMPSAAFQEFYMRTAGWERRQRYLAQAPSGSLSSSFGPSAAEQAEARVMSSDVRSGDNFRQETQQSAQGEALGYLMTHGKKGLLVGWRYAPEAFGGGKHFVWSEGITDAQPKRFDLAVDAKRFYRHLVARLERQRGGSIDTRSRSRTAEDYQVPLPDGRKTRPSGAMKGGTLYLVLDPFGWPKLETRSYREAQTHAKKLAATTGEPTKIRTISAAGTGAETSDTETVYPGARPYRWTPSEF